MVVGLVVVFGDDFEAKIIGSVGLLMEWNHCPTNMMVNDMVFHIVLQMVSYL